MPRKLKTYQTSLGFFDLAVAAPSMKAAADAWGSKTEEFRRGFAKQTEDPEIVAATMAKPGVVLKRPVGSSEPFSEQAKLPKDLPDQSEALAQRQRKRAAALPNKRPEDARTAAVAFEREKKRRDAARRKQQAAQEKARRRREQAIAKAERALELAKQSHEAKAKQIERQQATLEKRSQEETDRWEKQRGKLQTALRRARE